MDNEKTHPFKLGKNYFIRTVTMAISGRLDFVGDKELSLSNASWVADTGRFNEFLVDTAKVNENEPFKNDVIIGRGAIIDATIVDSLFTEVK